MAQMVERKRPVAGAELFIGETEVNILANLGDGAFDEEKDESGLLLGEFYRDDLGIWATAKALSKDMDRFNEAVGWFRTSEKHGTGMSKEDVEKHLKMFWSGHGYAVMIDPPNSSMAMYKIGNGAPVKARAAILENH